ncbi:ABC transporter ATP-binding protein [Plantactinospora sp. S1510]|uniref:ABC transporter ATP-binding protein n=1 Tax=Plantactinospora alkalitolerans TaxID=2789879 RepID=A0ABS0H3A7_9ACTN|nr:ABC transporter ATP-binding protein [Plantactinospora alkalitolerans]MBF9132597.1 ABC transporter ATP-binding protein [Plantactinospora alkalitolerans]
MLEVAGLNAWYGEAQALHEVSVRVGEGEVVTLVGRNGAGKTTLVRCLIGLHRQVSGTVSFLGSDVTRTPAHRRARAGMGWVQDDRGIYASLSVEENLLLPPRVSDRAWTLKQVYEAFPLLADRRKAPGTTLSGGEQQMLAIARVLRTGARLLLMDEPSEGLAPVVVARIGAIIREIKATGVGVLLIEQNVKFAATVADRHYLLSQGHIVETLDNSDFQRREGELLKHLGI